MFEYGKLQYYCAFSVLAAKGEAYHLSRKFAIMPHIISIQTKQAILPGTVVLPLFPLAVLVLGANKTRVGLPLVFCKVQPALPERILESK